MKKLIICLTIIGFSILCCSYVSNEAYDKLHDHPETFSGNAVYDKNTCTVTLTWDDSDWAHYSWDIFRTSEPNNEFSDYEYIWFSFNSPYDHIVSCSDKGVYYYKLAKYESGNVDPTEDYAAVSSPIMVVIE